MSDQARRAEIADLASRFVAARQSGVKIQEASLPWRPATFEEAIAVQDATLAKLGGELGGYKIFKVDGKPGLLGPIRKVDILASDTPLRSPMPQLGFECEIAFRFARTLGAPKDGSAYGREEVADAVACALAIIEVVETRFTDYPTDPNLIVADCFNSGRFVIGTEIPDWQRRDLSGALAEILIDGEVKVSKTGGHPNAHPFDSLPWFATEMWRLGRPLQAGFIVTTGSYTGNTHAKPGAKVETRFPGIGGARTTYVAA